MVGHPSSICLPSIPLTSYISAVSRLIDLNHFSSPLAGLSMLWQPQGPIDVQCENACHQHQHNSFSFDQMFQKLAFKVDMDKTLDKSKTWQDLIISLRIISH